MYSGIYYGHYKVDAHSDKASRFLVKKTTLISRTGCPPERWSHGLTITLDNISGIALVNKLQSIRLMEADFNVHNKLIFGKRMSYAARSEGIVPLSTTVISKAQPKMVFLKNCTGRYLASESITLLGIISR